MALSNPPSQNLSDIVNRKNATPDDFYGDGQGATASALPLNIQNATTTQQDIFLPDSQPLTLDTPKPKAGFFGTVAHDLYEDSEIGAGVRGVSSILEHLNHMNDVVPDGWTSYNKEMYKDIDQRYWDYMRDATSPAEQEARRQHVLSLQDRDDFYDNGKWVAHLLGGIGSVAASPSTYFLPIASTLKYAKTGQNIIKNMMRVAPSLSTQSIVHEAFVEGTKADGNLEQFALNSMRDVTFGLALTGVAAGIGKGFTGGKLWNTRKVVNMMYEGIDTKLKVGKDGVVKGYEAVPIPGVVANAQQLTQAQLFVDSKMAESGLFGLAFVGGTVTKVAAALSPVVRGLTHDFASINDFTNRFSDHSVIVEGMIRKEGRQALPLNFEREMWGVNNSVRRMTSQLEGYRAEANGLESSANREIAEKSLDEAITRGQSYNKEDFGRAVGMTIITGESHDNKAINSAAKYVSDHLEKVYKKYLTAHGYDENILSPRNAVNYLMQSWDRDAILQRPEDFINFISEQLEIQDNTILEHMAPVNEAQDFLNQLLEHKLTDSSYDRSLVNEIEAARNNVKEAEANLLKQIDENPELHALLEERLILNKDEAKQLSDLLKPRSDLEAKIAKQREVVTLLKKTKSQSKTSAIKAVKTETKIKSTGKMSAAEKKLIAEQDTLSNLERDLKEINVELREKADRREINPSMFKRNPETGEIIFRDPNVKPKFRGVYESQYHRTLAAQSLRETIMNTNEEAISQRILNGITGSSAANSTKERTVLIPQKAIQMANFLNNDISMNVANYTVALGRKTAWRTAYGEEGTEGIIYRHAQENREKERVILEKLKGDKQKKALIKLNKNFESGMTFIKMPTMWQWGLLAFQLKRAPSQKGCVI